MSISIVETLCKTASAIKYDVQKLSTDEKNRALLTAADKLIANGDKILAANREDIEQDTGSRKHRDRNPDQSYQVRINT